MCAYVPIWLQDVQIRLLRIAHKYDIRTVQHEMALYVTARLGLVMPVLGKNKYFNDYLGSLADPKDVQKMRTHAVQALQALQLARELNFPALEERSMRSLEFLLSQVRDQTRRQHARIQSNRTHTHTHTYTHTHTHAHSSALQITCTRSAAYEPPYESRVRLAAYKMRHVTHNGAPKTTKQPV